MYILREAWVRVRRNNGSAGVDGMRIEDVELYGVDRYLEELREDLRQQTYRPEAVKRKLIEKANGKTRPLGIPTVRDRIAQTACLLILEPIFEADFDESSYGFRPKRSSKGAIREIKEQLQQGNRSVYDADLSQYFDTIPHAKLMIALKERITDPRILRLIKKWLKVPVKYGHKMTGGKSNHLGTPQGVLPIEY
ncbi:hypothetical protein K4L44_06745 [Halosquirtibacter laminarini]|uniref:Uncharacterized protein n=1 Tax=Halosquirtibacter laminarini TaxID=3374600 RepID=A0AC61NIH3_9BACT|nr:hypothetical protein K4L44_06745 [Prolixibacteraceae bacterium]